MTIKVYISGICGSHEVRKHQQRVLFILQSLPIDLQLVDITEPGRDEDLTFMQEEAKKHEKKTQLPPQIFNDNDYCGDYADFELANDDDEIMRFLKLETGPAKSETINESIIQNGVSDKGDKEDSILNNVEENGIADFESNELDMAVSEENDTKVELVTNEGIDNTKEDIPVNEIEDKKSGEEEESD